MQKILSTNNEDIKMIKDLRNKEIEINKDDTYIIAMLKKDFSKVEEVNQILQRVNPKFTEDFELLKLVGTGSESYVYKSLFKKKGKELSIKLIYKEKYATRNLKEIDISKKMKHKNIINIYGTGEIKKGQLDSIIMEYAKFGNLRSFQKNILKINILSESLLCFFTYQILKALQYCHNNKIVHYDLKPQNIVVDNSLNIKLIDFSISLDYNMADFSKIKLPFRGTNFYMAPEVIKSKTIDVNDLNKVDLFSLGVILYNMAFGYYPFGLKDEDAKNYYEIYKKINKGENFDEHKNHFSPHFIDFLSKLLEKDINKRININQALNHYWIKGASILFDEKEKTYNCGCFLSYLISDHFKIFNDYITNIHDNVFF